MESSKIASWFVILGERTWDRLAMILCDPASDFSALSLLTAFAIAACFLTLSRAQKKRVRIRVLVRALLPRKWLRSSSSRADLGLMAMNTFAAGTLVGWAIMSASFVEHCLAVGLDSAFGPGPQFIVSGWVLPVTLTISFYLAYELAYFVDHYLSHHVPLLWHFHRVHHTAETLSPVTNYRVHPVDSLVFYNLVALCVGSSSALVRHIFGTPAGYVSNDGANAILLVATYLLTHLHHSHLWIAFTGRLGRLILSPAHHQLHHSSDPKHFNRNFGNTLALFDFLAGTLKVPTRKRERLVFGSDPIHYNPHSVTGLLIMPFAAATGFRSPISKNGRLGPHDKTDVCPDEYMAGFEVPLQAHL